MARSRISSWWRHPDAGGRLYRKPLQFEVLLHYTLLVRRDSRGGRCFPPTTNSKVIVLDHYLELRERTRYIIGRCKLPGRKNRSILSTDRQIVRPSVNKCVVFLAETERSLSVDIKNVQEHFKRLSGRRDTTI